MTKRFVVFNHKGGVSKTTSAYNIGWMLSKKKRVLLVDGDPQCNLTGLVLGDNFERYYLDDDTKLHNIKDGANPAFMGRPFPIQAVDCTSPPRAPNLFLLAGHADLSAFDGPLTFAHTGTAALSTLQNLPGAFSELMRLTERKYDIDFTIIDLNPGLSAINQNLFLSADAFIIPTNPDPFSIMALETLKNVLPRWAEWKTSSAPAFATSAYAMNPGTPKFLGTLIQRFNIRNGRAAKPYRDNIAEIKDRVSSDLVKVFAANNMMLPDEAYADLIDEQYCLSEIPDFQGLLPKSHDAGVPVFAMKNDEFNETGPILDNLMTKRDSFKEKFKGIAKHITRELGHA